MKTIVVLAVSIVLVSILFCPMGMAAPPPMPDDLQMVQPDPSLPKELSAFFGKWEGSDQFMQFFLIVEKIDEKKASLYGWQTGFGGEIPRAWQRYEGDVIKEGKKYKISYLARYGYSTLMLKGEYLDNTGFYYQYSTTVRFKRVP